MRDGRRTFPFGPILNSAFHLRLRLRRRRRRKCLLPSPARESQVVGGTSTSDWTGVGADTIGLERARKRR